MAKRLAYFIVVLSILLSSGAVFSSAQAADPLTRNERAEIRFLEGMIDHHQMALDMANDCLENGDGDEILAICQAVIAAQTPEIEQMQAWLAEWYNIEYSPMSMPEMLAMMADDDGGHGGHGGHSTMHSDPPMMMGMMAGFNRLSGVDYDVAWLESMIDHHDDALHMAERILPRAVHPELAELAEKIIVDQSAEIEAMEVLIEELSA